MGLYSGGISKGENFVSWLLSRTEGRWGLLGIDQQSHKHSVFSGLVMRDMSVGQVPSKCFGC